MHKAWRTRRLWPIGAEDNGREPFFASALSVALLLLPLAASARAQQRFRQTHQAMGTVWTLDLYAQDEANATALAEAAFDTVDRIDDELSNYKPSPWVSFTQTKHARHALR